MCVHKTRFLCELQKRIEWKILFLIRFIVFWIFENRIERRNKYIFNRSCKDTFSTEGKGFIKILISTTFLIRNSRTFCFSILCTLRSPNDLCPSIHKTNTHSNYHRIWRARCGLTCQFIYKYGNPLKNLVETKHMR